MAQLTRDVIQQYLSECRFKRRDLVEQYLRERFEKDGISGTVTRGGKTYDLVEYILSDLDSYGVSR